MGIGNFRHGLSESGTGQNLERLGVRMAARSNGKAGERLALVDETQADRQTIEIYELVTRKMRIGRVPLIFKALAAEKALVPCWQALRPAIRVRAFEEAADDLRVKAATFAVDLGCPLIETQLEWAGYDVDEIDEIRGQVDIFHYADAKLLMAAAALLQALNGGVGGAKATVANDDVKSAASALPAASLYCTQTVFVPSPAESVSEVVAEYEVVEVTAVHEAAEQSLPSAAR